MSATRRSPTPNSSDTEITNIAEIKSAADVAAVAAQHDLLHTHGEDINETFDPYQHNDNLDTDEDIARRSQLLSQLTSDTDTETAELVEMSEQDAAKKAEILDLFKPYTSDRWFPGLHAYIPLVGNVGQSHAARAQYIAKKIAGMHVISDIEMLLISQKSKFTEDHVDTSSWLSEEYLASDEYKYEKGPMTNRPKMPVHFHTLTSNPPQSDPREAGYLASVSGYYRILQDSLAIINKQPELQFDNSYSI